MVVSSPLNDHDLTLTHLAIPKLRESVHNDTEDDVETDGCDDDEESDVKHSLVQMICKRLVLWYLKELEKFPQCNGIKKNTHNAML